MNLSPIEIDTDRSFMLYPVDDGPDDGRVAHVRQSSTTLSSNLSGDIPGFHDIATVLQLTLPPELALPSLEKLSLHRLRDSMGHTLEYSTAHAPLPYAALPHLLTLLAHATPTLPLIQHIFDYLLVRPLLGIVYLVAAVQHGGQGDSVKANPELAETTPEYSNGSPQLKIVGLSPPTCKIPESPQALEGGSDTGTPIDGPASESSPHPPTIGHDDAHTPSIPAISGPSVPPSPPQQVIPVSDPSTASTFLDPADVPLPPSAPSTRPVSPVSYRTTELRLTHTLRPANAMWTWAQDASLMPSIEQAEALVISGVDIVVREPESHILKDRQAKRVRKRKRRSVRAHGGSTGGGLGLIGAETEWRALVGALGALGDRGLGTSGNAHVER
ncbi:hypothetical protein EDB87DRAFT_1686619 [Lactarius vividus]|nr:hypothetical protein EDB87DRAFT_1686619 [Lactarius vividus]